MGAQRTLGINGLGRIGKLTLWHQLGHDDFDRLVVNVGRPVGTSLDAIVQYIAKDSTYGALHRYLHGQNAVRDIKVVDEAGGIIRHRDGAANFLFQHPLGPVHIREENIPFNFCFNPREMQEIGVCQGIGVQPSAADYKALAFG